ncbi:hypothetical protein ACO0QE_003010 [Hanseniaspora vineae]
MILDKFHSRTFKRQQSNSSSNTNGTCNSTDEDVDMNTTITSEAGSFHSHSNSNSNSNNNSNSNSASTTPSKDEMVSKSKFFSLSPRKKQNKMVQLASLTTKFESPVANPPMSPVQVSNSSNSQPVASNGNSKKSNSNPFSFSSSSSLPYKQPSGKKKTNMFIQRPMSNSKGSSPLLAPSAAPQTPQFLMQNQLPSTPVFETPSSTPVFYKHKYQNSVTSLASSIDDNTPTTAYPPLNFSTPFIQLLLETYQEHCSNPTITPFDDANPPYGVTNIVAKKALKTAIQKNINLTITSNPLELSNNANVLAAIRKKLLDEVKRENVFESRNNSVISLSNVSVSNIGFNNDPTWQQTQQPQQFQQKPFSSQPPIAQMPQPIMNFHEGMVASSPLLHTAFAKNHNENQHLNNNNNFQSNLQYSSYEGFDEDHDMNKNRNELNSAFDPFSGQNGFYNINTNNITNSNGNSNNNNNNNNNNSTNTSRFSSNNHTDLMSPLEPLPQQQQQQQYGMIPPTSASSSNFMRPTFRSRNNSMLSELTRSRSNTTPHYYNPPPSAGSATFNNAASPHNMFFSNVQVHNGSTETSDQKSANPYASSNLKKDTQLSRP